MNQTNQISNAKFFSTQKIVILSLMCAIAYISAIVIRVPIVSFLTYDPKDIIIVLAGFIFSPIYSLIISILVSFIEMVTVSDSGPVGLMMNVLATAIFSLIATFFYKKNNSHKSIIMGLIIASLSMTAFMVVWNYIITPFYLGVPRSAVLDMLVPIIIPFNVIKSVLNSCIILVIYKPVLLALQRNKVISKKEQKGSFNINIIIISILLIISCVLVILAFNNII